ncbi:dTDP-4-amino-4,6-dideoxygalactose transaminase [bacterium]|nr:dTDP-4-amino-4,6-dideoxygalactose transaminase [bacterium]
MIPFNVPPYVGTEINYVKEAIENHKICGDGVFTKKCSKWLEDKFNANKVLLTTSGSTALDIAALLCELKPGDEVILPSYTFSSTANSFAIYGASLVFVDIRPDTMNIDENKIEAAITDKTKVIVVVHYAGVSCEMDKIMDIAKKNNLLVVEDAAQGVMSSYKGKYLGTIGDIGCFSFHETKNFSMGEGGAVVINNSKFSERAEIIREKGTDRSKFLRGQIDKYTWIDIGDSFLPSEMNAAYLWGQLEVADTINNNRIKTWNLYYSLLKDLTSYIDLPTIPFNCIHNGHMFYIKLKNIEERTIFQKYLKENGIGTAFHYIPLHSAPAGCRLGRFNGDDIFTTKESERLVRLPMFYNIEEADVMKTCEYIHKFFNEN